MHFSILRLKISLTANKPQILPLNYSYHLASMIYRSIQRGNKMLGLFKVRGSKELLEAGYKTDFGKQNSERFRITKVTE